MAEDIDTQNNSTSDSGSEPESGGGIGNTILNWFGLPHADVWELLMHIVMGAIAGYLIAAILAGLGVGIGFVAPDIAAIQSGKVTLPTVGWTLAGMGITHRYLGYP